MQPATIGRIAVAIDSAERALLSGVPTRKAIDALRADVARIVSLDQDERVTVPGEVSGASQVRGVFNGVPDEDPDRTPIRWRPGRR